MRMYRYIIFIVCGLRFISQHSIDAFTAYRLYQTVCGIDGAGQLQESGGKVHYREIGGTYRIVGSHTGA